MAKLKIDATESRDIVFSPNLVDSPIFGLVYDDFLRQSGWSQSETCKKTAKPGDLYLFYFGEPELKIAGMAICKESPDPPKGVKKANWPSRMFFCPMEELHHFGAPVTVKDIQSTPVLRSWWKTIPYRGRPKSIPPDQAVEILSLIAKREPKLAELLHIYISELRADRAASAVPKDTIAMEVVEGTPYERLAKHLSRNRALRNQKIRQSMHDHNGQLVCEVRGCGFNFLKTYGELGRGFAHVHHRRSLADRMKRRITFLSDLAIVCANCHAMIHRGGLCRLLKGLIS